MEKLDLLCLNLPYERPYILKNFSRSSRSPCVTRGGTIYEPLYLAMAVAFAQREGYRARIIDAVADDISFEQVKRIVRKTEPRLIVIDTSTPSIYNDASMAEELKSEFPKSEVILVGRHVTYAPKETLTRFCKRVKIVARNYFYQQVLDLLEGKELSKIKGISYREDGKVKHNPPADMPKGEFPFVSRVYKEQLDLRKYFYASTKYPYLLMNWQWGCRWNCSMCNEYRKCGYFARPIENVIEELKYIERELPWVKSVLWDDPTFVMDEGKVQELCNEIIDNRIRLSFGCATRANISLETLRIMKKANFNDCLHIGIESVNQENLDKYIHKGMVVEEEVEYLKRCKEVGIKNHGCFIIGFPADTHETLRMGLDYIKSLPALDSIQVFPLIPTPFEDIFDKESRGTAWELVTKNNYLIPEVYDKNGRIDYTKWLYPDGSYRCVVSYPHLSNKDIENWIEIYYREFYFRPSYIIYKAWQSLFSYAELQRNWMGFRTMLKRSLLARRSF